MRNYLEDLCAAALIIGFPFYAGYMVQYAFERGWL